MGQRATSPDRESALPHLALGPCQFSAKVKWVCQGKSRIRCRSRGATFRGGRGHATAIEQRLVQQLIVQPAVEALDKGFLHRLAWCDVVPAHPFPCPTGQNCAESVGCRYLRQ